MEKKAGLTEKILFISPLLRHCLFFLNPTDNHFQLSQVLGGLKYMVRQLGKTNGSVRILGELKSGVLLMMESVISSFLHEA